jgi:hypothetical protein
MEDGMKEFERWLAIILCIAILILGIIYDLPKANGFDKWETHDIALEAAWGALHALDWSTTLNLVERGKDYQETNTTLGKHPSRGAVNLYMGSVAVLHPLITYALPKEVNLLDFKIPVRNIFQGISIGISGGCAVKNLGIGLKLSF